MSNNSHSKSVSFLPLIIKDPYSITKRPLHHKCLKLSEVMLFCVEFFSSLHGIVFSDECVRHWKRLPKDVVDAPLLELLQVKLDGALIIATGLD